MSEEHGVDTNLEDVPPSTDVVAEIVISITDTNASYSSSLPPHEIIFWLDLMKFMILGNLTTSTDTPESDS